MSTGRHNILGTVNAALPALLTGIIASAPVAGLAAAGPDDGVDRRIEDVREKVLAVQRRVGAAARAREQTHDIAVYLREPGSDVAVDRVLVAAAGENRINHVTRKGSGPLAEDGAPTKRVGALPFEAASGGLGARATVREKENTRRIDGSADFAKTPLQSDDMIELVVRDGGLFTDAGLEVVRWRPDPAIAPDKGGLMSLLSPDAGDGLRRFLPGSRNDPRIRHALRLAAAGDPEAGLNRLLHLREGLPASVEPPDALLWALAETSLEANLAARARRVLSRLSQRDVDAERLARLQLRLGEIHLARGNPRQARRYLATDARRPPPGVRLEWQDLMVRVLLAIGDHEAAAAVFDDAEALIHEVRRKLNNPGAAEKLSAYSRYNRAIAFIRSGDTQRGRTWLDIVGRLRTFDAETRALRDKANTALGWQLLRTRQGLTAGQIFNRVRLDGPSSDTALLGAGWALLSQAGGHVDRMQGEQLGVAALEDSQLPDFVVDALVKRGILDRNVYGQQSLRSSFGRTEAPDNEPDAARRALRYWLDLGKRDIRSTAVQEGLLAIALAYRILGDEAEAAARYRRAAARFERARQTLSTAKRRVGDDAWLASFLARLAAPKKEPTADPESPVAWVKRAAVTDTDLHYIDRQRALDALERRITAIIRRTAAAGDEFAFEQHESLQRHLQDAQEVIDETRAQARADMRAELTKSLSRRRQRLRRYLESAYRGVASVTGDMPDQAKATGY